MADELGLSNDQLPFKFVFFLLEKEKKEKNFLFPFVKNKKLKGK